MEIYKQFTFEAAHRLPHVPAGHKCGRLHGHSFRARVTIDGVPGADTGYVFHFDELAQTMAEAQDALDHRLLNEVEGLEAPTLERIAIWLWNRLQNRVPGLAEIEIARDSCGEGAIYNGPAPSRLAAE